MLSKSRGQILRVAAVLHVLFHFETPLAIPDTISESAIRAAEGFVEMCNQYVAYLAGRGEITTAIESLQKGIVISHCCDLQQHYHITFCRPTRRCKY